MAIPVIDNPEDSFNYQPERSGFVISLASCLNAFTATLIALFLLIATVAPCSAVQVSTSRWESAPEYIGARWHPHSAHPNWYAYCGGDPVNRTDTSGLDWEWISGDDSTYLRGTDIKLWNNANGYWSFVPGSDPAVPRPLVSLDALEAHSPKVPIGASGNPTVDLNYFTANASVIDPRFDANYDRAPYIRDNAVYNAVVDGLARQMGVAGMPSAAQLEALSKIDAIGVRASWVRGRAQTSTMAYLDSSFWAQGGGVLDQLQAQTANAAMLYGLTTFTGAAGDLALMEAGGGAIQSLIAARNLQRVIAAQRAAGQSSVRLVEAQGLSNAYVNSHLQQFTGGASYLIPKSAYDRFVAGRAKIGTPDGQFVTSSKVMDDILGQANGDLGIVKRRLGIPAGAWNEPLYRIDISNPLSLNPRLPNHMMSGANPQFVPGGFTSGGIPELVIDQIPVGSFVPSPGPVVLPPAVPVLVSP